MVQVKDLTERTLEERWAEVKDEEEWWDEIKPRTLSAVKVLMESAMESELIDQLLAARYRRTEFRRGYRNGYRYRSLLTELGPIERIRIPRDREGLYRTEVLPKYERRQSRVNQMVREMFLAGVSTRRVKEVIKPLLGDGVSAQTVSRICRSLDAEVQRYHRRGLDDRYRYLLLDGIVLKVKGEAKKYKRRVVLCAYGITHDGVREMIDFRQASSESEAMWTPFLDCPQAHWKKVRTTNAIERAFRKVRRRTRPMSCFQNSASVERIIFGVISHLNTNWKDAPLPQFTH